MTRRALLCTALMVAAAIAAGCTSSLDVGGTTSKGPSPGVISSTPSAPSSLASPSVSTLPSPSPPDITKLTGTQLVKSMTDALRRAGSVRAHGTIPFFAESTTPVTLTVRGRDAHLLFGHVAGPVDIWTIGDAKYVLAPRLFWTHGLGQLQQMKSLATVAGHWTKLPRDSFVSEGTMDIDQFAAQLSEALTGAVNPVVERVTAASYHGQKVAKVSAEGGNFAYVALEGPPFPLFLHLQGGMHGDDDLTDIGTVGPFVTPDYEYTLRSSK